MVHIITYDLHKPDRDYQDVKAAIESFGSACEVAESVWLVDTVSNVSAVRDALRDATVEEATIFVIRTSESWSSYAVNKPATEWLHDPGRRW